MKGKAGVQYLRSNPAGGGVRGQRKQPMTRFLTRKET